MTKVLLVATFEDATDEEIVKERIVIPKYLASHKTEEISEIYI